MKDYQEILEAYKQEGAKLAKLERNHFSLRQQEKEMRVLAGSKEADATLEKIRESYRSLNKEIEECRKEEAQLRKSLDTLRGLIETTKEGDNFLNFNSGNTPPTGYRHPSPLTRQTTRQGTGDFGSRPITLPSNLPEYNSNNSDHRAATFAENGQRSCRLSAT